MAISGHQGRVGFRTTVILILTAGMALHLAFAIIVKGMLWIPLPYPETERLFQIEGDGASEPEAPEVLRATGLFDQLAYWMPKWEPLVLSSGSQQHVAQGLYTSEEFLPMLGGTLTLGRHFGPGDFGNDTERTVIISHQLWTSIFQRDPDVVGKILRSEEGNYVVIGVLTPGFRYYPWPVDVTVWLPAPKEGALITNVVRLKAGVTIKQAETVLKTLGDSMEPHTEDEQPPSRYTKFFATPLSEYPIRSHRTMVLILMGSSALVLLIAFANASGLFLLDSIKRRREVAIRMALGATRGSVILRRLLSYCGLFFASGTLAVAVAGWGAQPLLALVAPQYPRAEVVVLDGAVLAYALLLTVTAGFLFSFIPIRIAIPSDLNSALREQGERSGASRGTQRLNAALIAGQIGLALAILAGAGLLLRTYVTLYPSEMGIDPGGKTAVWVTLPFTRYTEWEQRWRFADDLRHRLDSLPSVEEVTVANAIPFSMVGGGIARIEGSESAETQRAELRAIAPGYLRFMGMRMLRGRPLDAMDDLPGQDAALINEAAMRRFWPSSEPIGKHMVVDALGKRKSYTVVGIVRDARYNSEKLRPGAEVYVPYRHFAFNFPAFIVKTSLTSPALAELAQEEVWKIDPALAIGGVRTIEDFILRGSQRRHATFLLLGIGAGVSLILALVGVYAMISQMVGQRVHEIGIRIALGARTGSVIALLMKHVALITCLGIGCGLIAAWAGTRYLKSMLYGITPTDPLTFVAASIAVFAAALAACYFPVRRATRIDPMDSLRYE